MIKSIQQFEEKGIHKINKVRENFMRNPADMASLVYGIQEEVIRLGLDMIKETLEDCDQMLRDSGKRRESWVIVRKDRKKLTTSMGTIEFEKTLFKNKVSKERAYLLDRLLEMESHERLTEDAVAKLLEEAVQTSYRRGGEGASLTDEVSKQTVKNKLHGLNFPETEENIGEKKVVDYLYIDADEDHVALQYQEKKGDLVRGANHQKNNCALAKLVYVYEGIEPEVPRSKRNRLINVHYFSGTYRGKENGALWDEVYRYIESHYELDKVKKIYLNADGGSWIEAGVKRLRGVTKVLDEFHLRKYLLKMISHMKDSAEDANKELCREIRRGTKEGFDQVVERLMDCTENERSRKRIYESGEYIKENWMAARVRLKKTEEVKGCSAEGHVSHVLSDRMSSRPMGWSRTGVDKMAHLRAYYWNKGDMLELVRKQKEELPKAAGTEEMEVLTSREMLIWERKHQRAEGKYVERLSHSIPGNVKQRVWLQHHIWGL